MCVCVRVCVWVGGWVGGVWVWVWVCVCACSCGCVCVGGCSHYGIFLHFSHSFHAQYIDAWENPTRIYVLDLNINGATSVKTLCICFFLASNCHCSLICCRLRFFYEECLICFNEVSKCPTVSKELVFSFLTIEKRLD